MVAMYCKDVLRLLVVVGLAAGTTARKWQDIVTRDIYEQPALNPYNDHMKIEMYPFFFPDEDAIATAPSPEPEQEVLVTMSPTTKPPTESPTTVPTSTPTGPTAQPTPLQDNVEKNGGCHEGTRLHQINMYDSWGNGWDPETVLEIEGMVDRDEYNVTGTTVTQKHTTNDGAKLVSISRTVQLSSGSLFNAEVEERKPAYPLGVVFEGGLLQGSHSSAVVCLMPNRCYQASVTTGGYLSQVSWDIRPVLLGEEEQNATAIIQGGAPMECVFSLPDETGESFCPSSCTAMENTDENPMMFEELKPAQQGGGSSFQLEQDDEAVPGVMTPAKPVVSIFNAGKFGRGRRGRPFQFLHRDN